MYASLNVVRAILGLSVMLYHLSGTIALEKYFGFDGFDRVFGFGGARVPFFFVLSGFLLTLVYARDFDRPQKLLPYLQRRFLRLFPTYWLILLLVMSPALLVPSLRDAIPSDPWVLLRTLLLIPQHPEVAGATGAPVIVVAWTLHYEIVFYLILGAWIWSRHLGVLLSCVLVVNAIACADGQCSFYRQFVAGGAMLYFALGAVTARLATRLPPMPHAMTWVWLSLAVYLWIAMDARGSSHPVWMPDPNLYFVGLACIILMGLVHAESARPSEPNARWVKLLSDSSYALYLLHFPLISLVCKLIKQCGLHDATGAVIAFVVGACVCIGTAIAFHLWIERRLLSWRWRTPHPVSLPG